MTDLADDKHVIGNSVGDVAEMADELGGLLVRLRPHAKADIAELQRILTIMNRPKNQAFVDETLQRLPTTLRRQARIGSHGSWYNYYLCDFDGKIVLPSLGPAFDNLPVIKQVEAALADIAVYSTAERCTP
jgi:phospholipid/cholesterol/gamma-HCH transport system substrate-binding protein